MEGKIDEIIAALQKADYQAKLATLTGHTFEPHRAHNDDED